MLLIPGAPSPVPCLNRSDLRLWESRQKGVGWKKVASFFEKKTREKKQHRTVRHFKGHSKQHQATTANILSQLLHSVLCLGPFFPLDATCSRPLAVMRGLPDRRVDHRCAGASWWWTPMTPIFEGQRPRNKAFSNQNKVIWVLGGC